MPTTTTYNFGQSKPSGMSSSSASQPFGGMPSFDFGQWSKMLSGPVQQSISPFLPTGESQWRPLGAGGFQQMPSMGPNLQQMWGGMLTDLGTRADLQQQNFQRQQQAANMFLNETQAAAKAALTAANPMFDKAYAFQKAGADQAKIDAAAFRKQLEDADKAMAATQNRVAGLYGQALGQVGQGIDRVASDAAAAIQRRKAADVDQIMGEMGGFAGTESQVQEAARRQASEYNRDLFGTVSNLQAGAAQARANVLQAQAGAMSQLGSTIGSMKQRGAEMMFDVAKNANAWNEFGANISMAHGKLAQDVADNYTRMQQMNLGTYAQLVASNPITGVTITPTLLAMAEAADKYGGRNLQHDFPNMIFSPAGYRSAGPSYRYEFPQGSPFR